MTPTDAQIADPTVLVTEAIERAIKNLMLALDARFHGEMSRVEEKFAKVDLQFHLTEEARKEQKVDTQTSINAALSASEKAAAKSEGTMIRSVEQLGNTLLTAINSQNAAVADLKDRVVRIESNKQGGSETKSAMYAALGVGITLLFLILAIGGFALSLAAK